MLNYTAPTFTAIPMAMICSKMGCPTPAVTMSVGSPNVNLFNQGASSVHDPLISVPQDISIRSDASFTYIYEPNSQLVFEINETGGLIIKQCREKPNKISELESYILNNFSNINSNIHDEIYGFIHHLKSSGFNISITS
ncbi:PqqD family peptide modification chaperone [Citrobacter portucalensis]|uniref:PqqD family peptide modification chaperone n=1 Tax=Citrobacter portucalensis TaxID=1639133 RepID=UPI001C70196D|nr:PqqD family peptide modification chaperone [Citrobacter portucalensis]MBW9454765.1 PqqD family peptide modification chaperone [Citrobacter portucalensis]MBW9455375.1 PqqD family peptide modification chaperone [Citrobacter portucalensis]